MAEKKAKAGRKARKKGKPVDVESTDALPGEVEQTPLPGDAKPAELLPHLLPQHRRLIEASCISPEVAIQRGYRSITVKADIERLGFARSQCSTPALLVPVYGVNGTLATYQVRPDTPRVNRAGRTIKYETPKGSRLVIDVPACIRASLKDPKIPLFITEGARKADAAASKGATCVALLGVWNWRGTNESGGKTILPDWESIALNGRHVYVVFDSDVSTKPAVYTALRRLREFLRSRDAKVQIVYLPDGPDGSKIGLDDFIALGHTMDDVVKLAKSELPPAPKESDAHTSFCAPIYKFTPEGIIRVVYDSEGEEELHLVANFTAVIVANVVEDDGVLPTRHFRIEVTQTNQRRVVQVSAHDFDDMDWVHPELGAAYVVIAGGNNRDHARAAIQLKSQDVKEEIVYVHTGWRKIGGTWMFLHAGGAITADGNRADVRVKLQDPLGAFRFATVPLGEDLRKSVRRSLQFNMVAREDISMPLLALVYRAALGGSDHGAHIAGPTGTFKTEVAALCQQHFGAEMNARRLPGSWSSTGNALEAIAFFGKDVIFVVDDFVPQGGADSVARAHMQADRVMRAQGNASGRQRMNADGTMRPTRSPRGTILSTGEEVPAGQSLRARMIILELSKGDVDLAELTGCQKDAAEGLYARAMAGFLAWVAGRREGLEARIRQRADEIRALAAEHCGSSHRRTPEVAAQLFVGFEFFAEFALSIKAVDAAEHAALIERAWKGILLASDAQRVLQEASDPVMQFVELLRAAVASGGAHITDENGAIPPGCQPESVGWQLTNTGVVGTSHTWMPRGQNVGWLIGGELFLEPQASYQAAQRMAGDVSRLTITANTLGRRLADRGMLVSRDVDRKKNTTRKYIQQLRRDVLHVKRTMLLDSATDADAGSVTDAGANGGESHV